MRLIDADAINWDKAEDYNGNPVYVLDKRDIDNEPTAYDLDKVVEELEERRANHDCKICKYYVDGNTTCEYDCADALIDDLIEIVKVGFGMQLDHRKIPIPK